MNASSAVELTTGDANEFFLPTRKRVITFSARTKTTLWLQQAERFPRRCRTLSNWLWSLGDGRAMLDSVRLWARLSKSGNWKLQNSTTHNKISDSKSKSSLKSPDVLSDFVRSSDTVLRVIAAGILFAVWDQVPSLPASASLPPL